MTRSITFNGQTQYRPGGITRVNASALTPIGQSATGILALIGEADGGAPGEVIAIDDPALAKETFGSGPLADAVRVAFDPSADPRVPGGAFRVLCYKTNQSTQAAIQLSGDEAFGPGLSTDTGATTTNIPVTGATLTVNAYVGRWLRCGGSPEKRRIVSNTASAFVVSPGFTTPPNSGVAASVLQSQLVVTSRGYGEDQNQISIEIEDGSVSGTKVVTLAKGSAVEQSPEICGDAFLEVKYVGGPIVSGATGVVSAATTSTITFDVTVTPLANAYANMVIDCFDGKRRLIQSNTAADPAVVTLAAGHELTAAEAAALVGTSVSVRNVTAATVTFTGSSGKATGLTSAVTPTADNLNITFTPGQTLRQLVDHLNANTNYEASIPDGVNPDTVLVSTFDFGTRNKNVDVRFDSAIDYANKGTFRRDLQTVVDWINSFSSLAKAAKATGDATEGSELPENTGGVHGTVRDYPVYLVGGTRGTSANSHWQLGFDALLEERCNQIVPLISYDLAEDGHGSTATFASVAAQLNEHLGVANTSGKSERGGVIGIDGTKSEIKALIASINNADCHVVGQKLTVLNVDGTLVEQPEWSLAVAVAGMRCGLPEVGEPLTFKLVKTNDISQDSSWSPKSKTDVNDLLKAGLTFVEPAPRGGFRIVRDITTHLLDDNICFLDGNTRDAVRYLAYDLRTDLEEQFTGLKAKPATVANIRERVAKKMADYREAGIIVDSLDENGVIVKGFRKLRVFINGNVGTIRAEVFPVTGIVFQLNDLYLSLPRLSA